MYAYKRQNFDVLELIEKYTTRELLNNLERAVGSERYRKMYQPMLERFVERVVDLPLTRAAYAEKGGTILAGVLAASLSVATCDKTIFSPQATSAQRMAEDGSWKWLAFCSTLANCYLICSAHVAVKDDSSGEEYNFSDDTPIAQLTDLSATWIQSPSVSTAKLIAHLFEFFYPGQFAHLDRKMTSALGLSINPALDPRAAEAPLTRIVRSSIQKVLADEKLRLGTFIADQSVLPEAMISNFNSMGSLTQSDSQVSSDIQMGSSNVESDDFDSETDDEPKKVSEKNDAVAESSHVKLSRQLFATLAVSNSEKPCVTEVGNSQLVIDLAAMGTGGERQRYFTGLKEAGFYLTKEEKTITLNAEALALYRKTAKIVLAKLESSK